MNIRKFLNKIILVSAAIFWAGCSNDSVTKAASDNEDATANPDTSTTDSGSSTVGDKSSSSSHVKSSSSSSSNYFNCRSIDHIWPIDYRDESYKKDPKEDAEKSAERRAQIDIHDSVLERIFHVKYYDEGYETIFYPYTTTFCLFKMADTLAHRNPPLYGALSTEGSITKSVYCPDGTTHLTEEYLSYEEDLKAHEKEVKAYEEQKAAYEEAYDKYFKEYYSKRTAELMSMLDSCVNHPDDFKLANKDDKELYCHSLSIPPLDSLEFYDSGICRTKEFEDDEEEEDDNNEEEEMSSSSVTGSSSEKAKSSSSSQKNNEGNFHGEFAKVK